MAWDSTGAGGADKRKELRIHEFHELHEFWGDEENKTKKKKHFLLTTDYTDIGDGRNSKAP
jgi:hypothetical protein